MASLALSHVKDIPSLVHVMTLSGTAVRCRLGTPQAASSPGMTGTSGLCTPGGTCGRNAAA